MGHRRSEYDKFSTSYGVNKSRLADLFKWLLTKFGKQPWTGEKVNEYLGVLQAEVENPKYHLYQRYGTVWGQKPFDAKPRAELTRAKLPKSHPKATDCRRGISVEV